MATLPSGPKIYQFFDVSTVLFALGASHSSATILYNILDSETEDGYIQPLRSISPVLYHVIRPLDGYTAW